MENASTVYPTLVDGLSRLSRDSDISLVLMGEHSYRALQEDLNSKFAYQSQHQNNYKYDEPLKLMEWEIMYSRQVPNYQCFIYTYPKELKFEDIRHFKFPLTPDECFKQKDLIWLEPKKM